MSNRKKKIDPAIWDEENLLRHVSKAIELLITPEWLRNKIETEPGSDFEVNNIICQWTEDDEGNWETGCDEIFVIIDGTPADNKMNFCCYCGRPLQEMRHD